MGHCNSDQWVIVEIALFNYSYCPVMATKEMLDDPFHQACFATLLHKQENHNAWFDSNIISFSSVYASADLEVWRAKKTIILFIGNAYNRKFHKMKPQQNSGGRDGKHYQSTSYLNGPTGSYQTENSTHYAGNSINLKGTYMADVTQDALGGLHRVHPVTGLTFKGGKWSIR